MRETNTKKEVYPVTRDTPKRICDDLNALAPAVMGTLKKKTIRAQQQAITTQLRTTVPPSLPCLAMPCPCHVTALEQHSLLLPSPPPSLLQPKTRKERKSLKLLVLRSRS